MRPFDNAIQKCRSELLITGDLNPLGEGQIHGHDREFSSLPVTASKLKISSPPVRERGLKHLVNEGKKRRS